MDSIDKQYKIKQFFKNIYRDIDFKEESIRILQYNPGSDIPRVNFFNDIDELVKFGSNKYNKCTNTYFQLTSTDGEGKAEHRKFAYCLGFDFDKGKQCTNIDDVIQRYKDLGLWYHIIIDSGNGYHAYTIINKTGDLDKYDKVVKALGDKLGADPKALISTQILRIPLTYNVKDKLKRVNVVHMYDKMSVKPYNIEQLYNRFCCGNFREDTKTIYKLRGNAPGCVSRALKEGSQEGTRNLDLYNIVVYLKNKGESLNYINKIASQWNDLNEKSYKDLDYQVDYIYNNCNGYKCLECDESIKEECMSYTVSDFDLEQYGQPIISISSKVGRQCRDSNRRGVICMDGNELFIYNVLVNNSDIVLNREQITELITDRKTNKCAISDKTLREALKGLIDKGYIGVIKGNARQGIADTYKLTDKKLTEDNSFKVTYFINLAVIWGRITTNELKCYMRMRYLHHEELKIGKAKGNIFSITMEDLAKDLGTDKAHISRYIKNLYENNILDRRAIPLVDDPKKFRYEYKLNM